MAQELDSCAPGEYDVDGFCTDDLELAETLNSIGAELEAESSQVENKAQDLGRRFQMGAPSDWTTMDDHIRTKRRTQRITMLITKVTATKAGKKMKPREFLSKINKYGCHCWTNPNTEGIGYRGLPLDSIDRTCSTLKSCHTCIALEYSNCDPVTTKYRAKITRKDGQVDIRCTNTLNAKKTNNGDCKRSLCECDKEFAERISEEWDNWDARNWNLEGMGVFERACRSPSVAGRVMSAGPPDQCCGSIYPSVKPFNSNSHQCVDSHVLPLNNL